MAFHRGTGGHVRLVGGGELCITEWSLEHIGEKADVTNSCGDGYRQRQHVLGDWNAEAVLPWNSENIPETDVGMTVDAAGVFHFILGNSGLRYRGPGVITRIRPINNAAGDVVRIRINIEGNGALVGPEADA